ncbi:interferon regulatory factor 4-like isoform X2 [Ascaphus truei]|uniref:interferon regulatory factor 4-like isoform X2 n=1 Tax=Ascaphus truei TaxID=8439 RepID=UPI003F59046D
MCDQGSQVLRLKEWLVLQVESGLYPGLRWQNPEKTLFRIPWKHAAKQDYSEQADATLFKAWTMYKGKYRDLTGKTDPTVWKTRLRCALNKSPDFQEVLENSQLDLAEPFKVYRILSEAGGRSKGSRDTPTSPKNEDSSIPPQDESRSPTKQLQAQIQGKRKEVPLETTHSSSKIQGHETPHSKRGCHVTGPFLLTTRHLTHKVPDVASRGLVVPSSSSDFWLHVRLYYQDTLVTEVTTQTADGCRIVPRALSPYDSSPCPPPALEEIPLPSPHELPGFLSPGTGLVLQRLLGHLDRGVLLWVAPEGVFVKRRCQGRVYWSRQLAPHTDRPNKLERERSRKVLDTDCFLQELQLYEKNRGPVPQYQIWLCFGEEYPSTATLNQKMLITALVEPVFARELLLNAQKVRRKGPQGPLGCTPRVSSH